MKSKRFKTAIYFLLFSILIVALGYLLTLYEGENKFHLLYHNWNIYTYLGYERFQFIYNFYMILAYNLMFFIIIKDFVLLNDVHYIIRQNSYKRFLNAILKHFFFKILLFNSILMSVSTIIFQYYDFNTILFVIKNTFVFVVMIYIYIFILHYIGDNQSLFLFMIILATMIDIFIGSHFLAYGDNMLLYIILYVILLIILKNLLVFLYKKGRIKND